ncbi:thiamine pyrophosphate-binding protein [Pelagibius sp. Alg239-R121]|uniref:thiamine pyrophosphate-binding protein n=1 Tax=Pelagibius sp. Alg239-R121 TaxID=2993448 RepID=UPI0024A6F9A9|nr:thiamine pyrophosphate-binding protein [Pelagibius sp. Alg239-R121]
MKKLTGGQAAVESLKAEKVEQVFGLIGSATMEMFDALYDASEINFVGVHDERTGTHMADGYARASGNAGVILAGQNGPGATNLVTGLGQAAAAFTPIVSIAGALSSSHVYRDAFQEVDQQALFSPITKKTWTATGADRVPEMFREAFRVAMTPRKGPVQLNLPRDVLSATAEFPAFQKPRAYRSQSVPAGAADAIAQAAELLRNAERPVIIAGGGIKNTGGHVQAMELAETLNAPVVTSPGHGDAVPFDHPLNAGQMGPRGNPVASRLVREADVILALGTRIGFNATFYSYDNINEDAAIIHVELEPTAIGRYFPIEVGIWADAPTAAVQLRAAITSMNKRAEVEAWTGAYKSERVAYLATRDEDAATDVLPIQPSGLFKALREVLPKDTAVTMDAGTLCLQATDALNYWHPKSLFTPLDFGLVGFSFACGLGVKLAQPERPVVSLMGDGGFGMTLSELSTAVDHKINTVTVVMNNKCWGAEKAYQRDFFGGRYIGADISSPRFDKVAELYGAAGFRAQTLDEMREAIEAALVCGKPAVVDVAVDPAALYSFRRDSFKHRGG